MSETKPEGSETSKGKVICILAEGEMDRLMALTLQAQKAPVIVATPPTPDCAGGQRTEVQWDCTGPAWQKVRDLWDELGQKYAFNPAEVVLKPATREILEDEELRKFNLLHRPRHSGKRHGDRNRGHGRRKH